MKQEHFDFFKSFLYEQAKLKLPESMNSTFEDVIQDLVALRKVDTVGKLVQACKLNPEEELQYLLIFLSQLNCSFTPSKSESRFIEKVLPELSSLFQGESLNIWYMPTANGHGLYGMLMQIDQLYPHLLDSIKIFATDHVESRKKFAEKGTYTERELRRGISLDKAFNYFDEEVDGWKVIERLKRCINFKQLNPLNDKIRTNSFHAVICHNFLHYQSADNKKHLIQKIEESMVYNGTLLLGEGESILGLKTNLESVLDNELHYFRK